MDTGPIIPRRGSIFESERRRIQQASAKAKPKQDAIHQVTEGPLGSIDPRIPVDIGGNLGELGQEDGVLANASKRDSIRAWKDIMDKAGLFRERYWIVIYLVLLRGPFPVMLDDLFAGKTKNIHLQSAGYCFSNADLAKNSIES